jgi:hypothetical protein
MPILETHYTSRSALLAHLTRPPDPRLDVLSPLEKLIPPLLRDWHDILFRGEAEMAPLIESTPPLNDDLLAATRKYFGEFLAKGLHHLASFPDSGDSFISVSVSSVCSRVTFESTIVSCSQMT